eukprot:363424-Chlamydomonas_euryale.AAC.6
MCAHPYAASTPAPLPHASIWVAGCHTCCTCEMILRLQMRDASSRDSSSFSGISTKSSTWRMGMQHARTGHVGSMDAVLGWTAWMGSMGGQRERVAWMKCMDGQHGWPPWAGSKGGISQQSDDARRQPLARHSLQVASGN